MSDQNLKTNEMNDMKNGSKSEGIGSEVLLKKTEISSLDMAKTCGKNGKLEDKKMSEKKKDYKVRYETAHGHGIVVTLPFDPRKHICDSCGKSVADGEIRVTALHHWWYAYQPNTVRENPILAIENTSELCFGCHPIGDAIRALLYANPSRVAMVAELLRGEPREKFIKVIDEVSRRLKEQNVDLAKKILEMGKR